MKLHSVELLPRAPGLSRTIVLLHGFGADEHDLLPVAHELDPRLRAVSLRAPISLGGGARAWFNLQMGPRGMSFDEAEVRAGLRAATDAVEEIAASSPRPILLGFSQGGGMAVGVALTRPELVGPVLSFSGVLRALGPDEMAPAGKLRGLHVFAAHGLQDPLVPIALGRTIRDELTRLGVDLSWHEYPMGHMVIPEELADARHWLNRLATARTAE
jgi:phospholipase/carboxylesterase